MNPSKKFSHSGIEKPLSRCNSDPWQDDMGANVLSFDSFLLSESQIQPFVPPCRTSCYKR